MSSVTTTVSTENSAGAPPTSPRKGSVFGKMFDNFKFGDKGGEHQDNDSNSRPSSKQSSNGVMDEKSKSKVRVEESHLTPFSANETQPIEHHKRSLSVAIADVFRRPSESSTKSRSSSPVRKNSANSIGHRKHSFFQSHNPDYESDPNNPRNASVASQDSSRKNSYVPRNATASFLTSTTLKTDEEKERIRASISNSSAGRSGSVAVSDTSETPIITGTTTPMTSGRRPSGMMPNNVAARYMRSASLTEEEKAAAADGEAPTRSSRRRASGNKSRQNSDGSSATVKPVALAPEQYAQWQNSVSKSLLRTVPFSKPGETLERHRMQSLAGIADVAEVAEEDERRQQTPPRSQSASQAPPDFRMNVMPASPPRNEVPGGRGGRKMMAIDAGKANSGGQGGRMDSALADSVSPRTATFGGPLARVGSREKGSASPKATDAELESLGFRGAVRA